MWILRICALSLHFLQLKLKLTRAGSVGNCIVYTIYCTQRSKGYSIGIIFFKMGKWADPSDTAILGQPVNKSEQAPELIPLAKISLISKGPHGPRIRY